jgi:hypothetical protein
MIIHTSKIRAIHTASVSLKKLDYSENSSSMIASLSKMPENSQGKTHEEMLAQYNAKTGKSIEFSHENIRRIYKEEGGKENIDAVY